ncbi:MAG: carboxylate-amine ligase [Hyphomicrobiaceae bacterium]|nr:carboxylate-amine ligase [Hyphomicrobiaceae bacterium]
MPAEPSFTFGIEEEYHLVDRISRDLTSAPPELIDLGVTRLGERVSPEFLRSQIEIGTPVMQSFADARAELARLRGEIVRLAAEHGLAPIAAGTHPFADWSRLETSPKARYQILAQDLAVVGRRLVICGMHVHVAIEDDELRIDIMNQARYFLPHLLILSTSSPFWMGRDTGLKSFRLALSKQSPRTGLPGRFSGWDEYRQSVEVLVKGGVMEDASKIWWDLRPSARFPTLEMRITDVVTRLDDAIAIAAIYVCLCRMLWRLRRGNVGWRTYPVFLLEENRWRAQRYGVTDKLFDLGKGELVPYPALLEEILALIAEDADALGCCSEVTRARAIVRDGTSADRQLAVHAAARDAGAEEAEALRCVVDHLVAETAAGL